MWLASLLIGVVRLLVGATPRWIGSAPASTQRIYFAQSLQPHRHRGL